MLWNIVYFLSGLTLLIFGADWLVKGASRVASKVGISPLVIGLTVVAFGTSAPELAINIQSSLNNQPDIAIGNVLGSNICNILLILGLSALITPLIVDRQLIRLDVPLMIAASLIAYLLALNGIIGRVEGFALFSALVIYIIYIIKESRKAQNNSEGEDLKEALHLTDKRHPFCQTLFFQILCIVGGLVMLVFGSKLLVLGAVNIAQYFGVSELVIALTIVALGTSAPELATSAIAAFKGERDIAVGNVVGSNIFNILSVLGLSALISPNGIPISAEALAFDFPVMLLVAFAALPIFFSGGRIDRLEGGIFLFYYIAYTLYLVLKATQSPMLEPFIQVILYGALPLSALLVGLIFYRELKSRAKPHS